MQYYLTVLHKYAVFSGRAPRAEYWYFFLFNMIISIVLGFADGMIGSAFQTNVSVLGGLYGLAVFIPGLAVTVRRLHDTARSGWMIFIGLIPVIGWIWLLVLLVKDSGAGDNAYGPNPKGAACPVPPAPNPVQ